MNTIEEVREKRNELLSELRKETNLKRGNKIMSSLKELEQKENELRAQKLVDDVNRKQERLRELARKVWECELPSVDITCADGSFHKTRVKAYPKLAALEYARGEWRDGRLKEIRTNGECFTMYRAQYEYGKDTEYTPFETFADFLEFHGIMPEPITMEQYTAMETALNDAKDKVKAAMKEYDDTINGLNTYQWQHVGLVGQSNEHFYTHTINR